MTQTVTKIKHKIEAIKPADFQAAEHRFRSYDCTLPRGTRKKDLENPELWVNVAPMLNKGIGFDQVRAMPEDQSFIAYLIPTFSHGTDARLKLISFHQLEPMGEIDIPVGKYDVKLLGTKKFVLLNTETGEHIKENIPTKVQAYKELDDYVNALMR